MSKIPQNLKYAASHEWVRREDSGEMTIGITDHAQELLGDIVYVELPEVGKEIKQGEVIGVIESVKAASDLYAPISGVVRAVNEKLADEPELANHEPYDNGWFLRLEASTPAELEKLLTPEEYAKEAV